ncbi:hypothetical protein L4D77_28005 [Photobacterium frigidiphilum]|uniref:hypothetical protein n=1 Tax=Photobacterium frigidiphilum TaxID=264736 RepID=UPI003D106909
MVSFSLTHNALKQRVTSFVILLVMMLLVCMKSVPSSSINQTNDTFSAVPVFDLKAPLSTENFDAIAGFSSIDKTTELKNTSPVPTGTCQLLDHLVRSCSEVKTDNYLAVILLSFSLLLTLCMACRFYLHWQPCSPALPQYRTHLHNCVFLE